MGNISVRPFEDKEEHYLLMVDWCGKDTVWRWFEQRKLSPEEITEKYRKKLAEHRQKLFLIYLENEPIGFTQIYEHTDKEFEPLKNYASVYEFDLFIGEEQFLSKGLGTAAVKTICGQIFRDFHADCIVLQPFERNERALRCYEKAGFTLLGKYRGQDTLGNPEIICVLYKTPLYGPPAQPYEPK